MKWLLLDDSRQTNQINTTILGISQELAKTEMEVGILQTMRDGNLIKKEEVLEGIYHHNPDVILWQSVTGYRFIESFVTHRAKKICLWFDDPIMRIDVSDLEDQVKAAYTMVTNGIWDRYWRERWFLTYNSFPKPIHLAVSDDFYYDASAVYNQDNLVFIGNLHSPKSIAHQIDTLPAVMRQLARDAQNLITHWPEDKVIPSWDVVLTSVEKHLLTGDKMLLAEEVKKSFRILGQLRWIVWALAKNETRMRILKLAMDIAPMTIFYESEQGHHASEDEFRALIGCWGSKATFHSTNGLAHDQLYQLHHHGFLHINATDPQSVHGGVPYRVFQTAASGRPLLTDTRPELVECFQEGSEILTYQTPKDFPEALQKAYTNKKDLPDIGSNARKRFLKDHTWKNRVETIKSWL